VNSKTYYMDHEIAEPDKRTEIKRIGEELTTTAVCRETRQSPNCLKDVIRRERKKKNVALNRLLQYLDLLTASSPWRHNKGRPFRGRSLTRGTRLGLFKRRVAGEEE